MYDVQGSPLPVFRQEMPCGYFQDGRRCCIEYVPSGWNERFSAYLAKGFRRFGPVCYRYVCVGCPECVPIRIVAGRFNSSRSQRRTLKRNEDIRLEINNTPSINRRKLSLFSGYLKRKHNMNGVRNDIDALAQLESLHFGFDGVIEMDYYLGERLIAVGIVDLSRDALSSNYFYYDCAYLDRRPGILSVLKEVELAGQLGKRYYYLGYYVSKNSKMAYKGSFTPHQLLIDDKWREVR